ncbi:MAG TPA: hypothetical protein DEH78_12710, partial [Solibacterales bacterium]|nr:hypothetical protein [Bryobacterales bacterium]
MSDLRIRPSRAEAERAALDSLLRSGLFDRAPGLGRLLQYICGKYFKGEADEIKEYNIAVEAMGRSADFDQKKDSIVRVEAHRLRKRLQQYYANDGAGLPVQICIPEGRYVPKFVFIEDRLEEAPPSQGGDRLLAASSSGPIESENVVPVLTMEVVEPGAPRRLPAAEDDRPGGALFPLVTAAAVLLLVILGWVSSRQPSGSTPAGPDLAEANPVLDSRQPIRILAGRTGKYLDRFGREWMDDRYFTGGTVAPTGQMVGLRAPDAGLYASRREGDFTYDIPVEPGVYEVHLHFAETVFGEGNPAGGGETSRLFDVSVAGQPLLTAFDVIADAHGSRREDIKVFRDVRPGKDGKIHIRFQGKKEIPFVNAIEVLPGTAGRMRPVRLVAQEQFFTDRTGRVWSPDSFAIATGGVLVPRPDGPRGAAEPNLFRGERYGHFTYVIPVAPGRYTLTLHFAESWFGTSQPGGGGPGSRVFEVSCNDRPLLTSFEVDWFAYDGVFGTG